MLCAVFWHATCNVIQANEAMESTKQMLSKRGRSSKLGERSIGHIDPGAASSAMIINTFFNGIKNLHNS